MKTKSVKPPQAGARKPGKPAIRITLKCGRQTRRVVLCGGPVPEIGDECTGAGVTWIVAKVQDIRIIAQYESARGKLRQVFP